MVEMAPDFTSDSPADWKPSGVYEGAVFLGQILTKEGQVFRRSYLREALRLLKPLDPMIRVTRAALMLANPNLVSGFAQPRAADFLGILDPLWQADIEVQSKRLIQTPKVFLCWLSDNPDLDGAVHPLQEPHKSRWTCLGRPENVEGVWALSYRS